MEPNGTHIDAPSFRLLFEAAPHPYLVLKPDSRFTIIAVNDRYLTVTGTRRDQIAGRGLFEVFPDNPDDHSGSGVGDLRASLERVLRERTQDVMGVQKYDIPLREGEGFEVKYWSPVNSPVFGADGDIVFIIHHVEDITDFMLSRERATRESEEQIEKVSARAGRMEAEVMRRATEVKEANRKLKTAMDELAQLNERLKDLDRAKTEFFSNVSHEFRTPLTLALGPLENALALPANEYPASLRASLEVAHRNALRLLKLVNTLLDFSRIEANRARAVWESTDIAAFTADLASNFQSACERGRVRLIVDCPPLPQPVEVDRGMWEKIVLNLLSNAVKFTFDGQIELRLRAEGEFAELTVSDTGIGIPQSELPRLFERFYRVEGSPGRAYEGTGIGLALVDELVRLQGGTIRVESEEGKGSRFIVRLPLGAKRFGRMGGDVEQPAGLSTHGKAVVAEAAHWMRDKAPPREPEAPPASRGRIVVADDNSDMRRYIRRLIEEAGYSVTVAADGAEALALCQSDPPSLVLSDVMMPVLDGFGLLKELRANGRTATLPIILLSARAGEESRISGLSTGADDYLTKPFHAAELVARVDGGIRMARVRREVEEELRKAKETAESATRLKDKFLSLAAHDLGGPLIWMGAALQRIHDEVARPGQEKTLKYVETVQSSMGRMKALVTSLLNVGRFKTGKIIPHLAMIDARDMATKELALIAPFAEGENVRLVNEVAEGAALCADPELLAEVIQNLLSNAIKFSSPGMSVRILNPAPGMLAVEDEGSGIAPEHAEKLFRYEEFFSTPGTAGEKGTGLGLPLCHDIIQAHGGELMVKSELGKGSRFTVRLPVNVCPKGECETPGSHCDWKKDAA